jgi:hypothetical protein
MVCQVMGESASGRDFQPVSLQVFLQKRAVFAGAGAHTPKRECYQALICLQALQEVRTSLQSSTNQTNPDASLSY